MAADCVELHVAVILVLLIVPQCSAFLEGIYCGKESCYDVLEVGRDATKSEIAKAYRQMARKFHPDMHRGRVAKEKAEEKFKTIATAYEILKDEDARKDYDYMLDNPDEVYRHYFHYYRRRMAPQVDVRYVIVISITVISVVQYLSGQHRYHSAISYLITIPKYRLKALDVAKRNGLLDTAKRKVKKSKDELKTEEDAIIRKVLEDNMDIRGGYAKPKLTSVLWIQIVLSPYTLSQYIWWNLQWFWRFTINKEAYGTEEQLYIIQKYLKCSGIQWEAIDNDEKEEYLKKQLWIKEKFELWKEEKEVEMKTKLAENARYKSYRRAMKGRGQAQFVPED